MSFIPEKFSAYYNLAEKTEFVCKTEQGYGAGFLGTVGLGIPSFFVAGPSCALQGTQQRPQLPLIRCQEHPYTQCDNQNVP